MRITNRSDLGRLSEEKHPADVIQIFVAHGLRALESAGTPDWGTLKVTIEPGDELFAADHHVLTITALEA